MFKEIKAQINAPKGFKAAGMHSGVKRVKKDLALIYSETKAQMAGVYTTNQVKAAPVLWNQDIHQKGEGVHAIVINSGNANACTGDEGKAHNESMASTVAESLKAQAIACEKDQVLVASTGVIGVQLPIDKITKGIEAITPTLSDSFESGEDASMAIMTTDTFSKKVSVEVEMDGKTVTISGMAKGSGMIHPNMATMLSFILTDANIDSALLQTLLTEVNGDTYNMITVDGDTSTNDMVLVLANGAAGNAPIVKDSQDYEAFKEAFFYVNKTLSRLIVKDGEGAGKLIETKVFGAANETEAKQIVKSVLSSSLVKTAFFGEDANWGRVLCAAGYSGASFDPEKVSLYFESEKGKIDLLEEGKPLEFSEDYAKTVLSAEEIGVIITLKEGDATAVGWGCDLSYEYVRINGEYRS